MNALGDAESVVTGFVDARRVGLKPSHIQADIVDRANAGENAKSQGEKLRSQKPRNRRVRKRFEAVFEHFQRMEDPDHNPREKNKGEKGGEEDQEVEGGVAEIDGQESPEIGGEKALARGEVIAEIAQEANFWKLTDGSERDLLVSELALDFAGTKLLVFHPAE